ncbi:hypothetical protein VE25_00040 [Devosia geojensis]|uniref:Flp pilus-assembly TadG-like N-terminal domain-containing protein n=1 Tax=Devosia geojensis TaxID=443610 RepID=A0A0F5FYZ7_9HYPH|nr:TadE/TadG family type IV pilus assembly protein [Devosia geojensis]KKB13800.1 hypothetical protein VE25_00040 [Devosia geojensis]
MRQFLHLIERFRCDERGVFAVVFSLMAIILIAMAGAVVDFVSLQQARNRAQVALDAATLALHSQILAAEVDADSIRARAEALVVERIGDPRISAAIEDIQINQETGSLYFAAMLDVPTIFVRLVGVRNLGARIESEATRGSRDIEVAVALDVTGSMKDPIAMGNGRSQQKIEALRAALGELINLVVQDEQTPTYSKMALVPYSMGVNVGSAYAEAIRGPITGPTAITNVAWADGTAKGITGATRANPVVITSNNHGFQNGDRVFIAGVRGMTNINDRVFTVANRATNTFALQGIDGRNYGAFQSYTPAGTATRCLTTSCELVVSSARHGLGTGQYVYIEAVGGTRINNSNHAAWQVGTTTTNTFVLAGTSRTNGDYGAYSSGGRAYCTEPGCEYFFFRNAQNNWRRHQISTCVTERTDYPFTDDPPSTAYLGRNYPSSGAGNNCLPDTIVPLTSDKGVLSGVAQNLSAVGSTAGHIGIAWAWYMVSSNFNGPWPAASQPAPADEDNVMRAVVLMTDGEFNTVYSKGVISRSSTTGSGGADTHINEDAPNGSSYTQTQALCTAMKAAGITVYTVGFDLASTSGAQTMMNNCASSPDHAYQANTGQQLVQVFEDIGRNLAQLRVTR